MAVFVALLRAINVGGTGKLPMSELRKLCEDAGFKRVTTYIQSGNVVLSTRLGVSKVRQSLETALQEKLGKPTTVHLRTPAELAAIVEQNPFPKAPPNRVLVHFLDGPLPRKALVDVEAPGGEEIVPSGREVYVHYPDGSGRSKLKLPMASTATARNLNTVKNLLDLGRAGGGRS